MAYLRIREEYRWATFASALFMLAGLSLLAMSLLLEKVNHELLVLAPCLLVPLTTSIVYHQPFFANWAIRADEEESKINWVMELLVFSLALGCIIFISSRQVEAQGSFYPDTVFPVLSSICIGCSLGLFKKVALAERRAGPSFVTTFTFHLTLAVVLLSPYLKYPSLAQ